MRYIDQSYETEIVINKSRFIASLQPVSTAEDVFVAIERARITHPKANHHCHGAMIGSGGEQQTASDDGEPSRTAGIPILEVIRHYDVTNAIIIVTRYFGGIKLGAGGLVRAYTKAASLCMQKAILLEKQVLDVYDIVFGYDKIALCERHFQDRGILLEKTFTDVVTFRLALHSQDSKLIEDIRFQLLDCRMTGQKDVFKPISSLSPDHSKREPTNR